MLQTSAKRLLTLLLALAGALCAWGPATLSAQQPHAPPGRPAVATLEEDFDFRPPQRNLGERLFLETRFSQFYFAQSSGDANKQLTTGDPALQQVHNVTQQLVPGPFASGGTNCRSCHYVDELANGPGSNRTYADFESRSHVPARFGNATTSRNSINFVNAFIAPENEAVFHADGEFATLHDLVESTLTGRNFGWKPDEHDKAVAHIAHVIRDDNGSGPLSRLYGGPYRKVLLGTDNSLRAGLRLPERFRMDVVQATDRQIMDMVDAAIEAYLRDLHFSRSFDKHYDGSPYDVFLRMNGLPMAPDAGESADAYARRLQQAVDSLAHPRFVRGAQFRYQLHPETFEFGELELTGLKLFLSRAGSASVIVTTRAGEKPQGGRSHAALLFGLSILSVFGFLRSPDPRHRAAVLVITALVLVFSSAPMRQVEASTVADGTPPAMHIGNCVSCHTPPDFTDFRFHNNGAEQEEYDSVHGDGAFAKLHIPDFADRQRHAKRYLPATSGHPHYKEWMRSIPQASDAHLVDLGVWNIFGNPDYPAPQAKLARLVCGDTACSPAAELPRTIALFKTPTLRDLADSQPYMHTGRMANVEQVLVFYRQMSAMARAGRVRNGDPALAGVSIDEDDSRALAAFLRSLTEDYETPLPIWAR